MKKLIIFLLMAVILLPSCATLLMGPVGDCQRTRPALGQPQREIRVGLLLCDLIFFGLPLTLIDFATCAIYKPCGNDIEQVNNFKMEKEQNYRDRMLKDNYDLYWRHHKEKAMSFDEWLKNKGYEEINGRYERISEINRR